MLGFFRQLLQLKRHELHDIISQGQCSHLSHVALPMPQIVVKRDQLLVVQRLEELGAKKRVALCFLLH